MGRRKRVARWGVAMRQMAPPDANAPGCGLSGRMCPLPWRSTQSGRSGRPEGMRPDPDSVRLWDLHDLARHPAILGGHAEPLEHADLAWMAPRC